MSESRRRRSVSQTHLLNLLSAQLVEQHVEAPAQVVDLGGGTGGIATALADLGHHVTVIDPSPDALASLERRTAEAGLAGNVRGVQGDANDLVSIIGPAGAGVVVCHRVLEVVDSPADALSAMATVCRPGGFLSLLVSQRHSVVLTQALNGHIALARRTFSDPNRFQHDQIVALVRQAGFEVLATHGIGAISDHVPEALVESEPGAFTELYALEAEISQDPTFRALAPVAHVFGRREANSSASR
ncbi:MAG TPA: methyltransferase domain-containing protein [Propionibacteriaceae bacterium]|nr:methyltransferase domain-containing protein [Propionibacteriaceae bacterium]